MDKYKIVYEDTSPTATKDAQYSGVNNESFANLDILHNHFEVLNVATLEHNFWRLDGSKKLFPDNPKNYSWGFWSSSVSNGSGVFESIPELIVSFPYKITTVGLTFDFDTVNNEYPAKIKLTYCRDGLVITDKVYEPTSTQYFCNDGVQLYNKVKISFLNTTKTYRRARLTRVYFGVIRVFGKDEIKSSSMLQEINPVSSELSINTFDFSVRNISKIPFLFQKMQHLSVYFDNRLLGLFYIDNSKRKDINYYDIQCVDSIGVLDKSTFYGGMYTNYSITSILNDIFKDTNITYSLDTQLNSEVINGYIPVCSKRDALLFVCFATCCVADTSNSPEVNIYKPSKSVVTTFNENNTFIEGDSDLDSVITGVELTAFEYTKSATQQDVIFKGVLPSGNQTVTFNEPYYNITCSGGTLVNSQATYAIVNSSGSEITLSGYKYMESKIVYKKDNPNISATDVKNVRTSNSCTLVNTKNASRVLQNIYDYFTRIETVNAKVVINNQKCGDVVIVPNKYGESSKIQIESINFSFGQRLYGKIGGRIVE